MKKTFLTAEWRKLILVNYVIDPEILKPYLPYKTEIDLWEGKCYVSLVAFMFKNTKVMGMKLPFHVNFEEANLRFYVKHKTKDGEWRRGVVFIKEIVPKAIITFVANTIYKEHYQTMEMKHKTIEEIENIQVSYSWKNNDHWDKVSVKADNKAVDFKENTEVEFITEHFWGYTKINKEKTSEYEVAHPKWSLYNVWDYSLDINFEQLYGKSFSFLKELKPKSIMLAEGSEISVGNKRIID